MAAVLATLLLALWFVVMWMLYSLDAAWADGLNILWAMVWFIGFCWIMAEAIDRFEG